MPNPAARSPATPAAITQPGVTDEFIGHILPDWLRTASVEQINDLRDDFARLRHSQQAVHATLDELQAIDAFAQPLLADALHDKLNYQGNLDSDQWREVLRDFKPSQGIGLPSDDTILLTQPLMQRLLQGFGARQTAASSYYAGTAIVTAGELETVLLDAPEKVASVCRELDVGRRFQQHLEDVFAPAEQDLAEEKRLALQVAARLAHLRGQIDALAYQMLEQVVSGASQVSHGGLEVRIYQLSALNCQVSGAVVFEVRGEPPQGALRWTEASLIRGLLVYLPTDRQQPLRSYRSWFAFNVALAESLKGSESYRAYFSALIGLQQRAGFALLLATRITDSSVDLDLAGTLLRGDLFTGLCQLQLARIKADARVLAVPTADVDSAATRAWRSDLAAAGWTALNLVGLFVPAVGGLLLGHLALQTLSEVFEGAEDWLRGHRGEALEHLLGVAQTVAVTVALGAGIHSVGRAFKRSDFVQSLLPVTLESNQPRLWRRDLRLYQLGRIPAGSRLTDSGLHLADGRSYLPLRGAVYEVRRVPQQGPWRLVHQQRAGAYGPVVEFNGERAWRLRDEWPLAWQGQSHLLERLWPAAGLMSVSEVSALLQVAAIDEDELRGLLVENRRMPIGLRDTLERFAQHQHGVSLSTRYLPDDPLLATLQRDFPTLPDAYGLALLAQASDEARALLAAEARVPLGLAEQARMLARVAQLTRAREGLYLGYGGSLDSAHLVFYALRRLPGWPQEVNLALHDRFPYSRLLDRLKPEDSPGLLRVIVHQQGVYQLYGDQPDGAEDVELSGGLLQVIAASLNDAQREGLGWQGPHALGQMRADLIAQLPVAASELEGVLGLVPIRRWFNPGHRLADGRVGYLLSGRGAAQAMAQSINNRLCALFPGLDAEQREAFIARLRESGSSVLLALQRLEQEYQVLDQTLSTWEAVAPAQASGSATVLLSPRNRVAEALRHCWRRQSEPIIDANGILQGYRLSIVGRHIPTFPNLPGEISFAHVVDVVMVGMRMRRLPASFFRAFSNTRWLNLSNNFFDQLPSGLEHMSALRTLRLEHNHIALQAMDVDALARLNQLRMLVLDNNPLRRNLNLRPLHRLRELSLRNTGMQALPRGLLSRPFLEQADLRNNLIATLPERFFHTPGVIRDAIYLQGNPLAQATWQRLAELDGMQLPEEDEHELPVDARAFWLATLDERVYEVRAGQWDDLARSEDSAGFLRLLGELTGTADYRMNREDLSRRVWALVEEAVDSQTLRSTLFKLASAPRTCVDSVSDCFSNLEVGYFLWQAEQQPGSENQASRLLGVARRLFRLERVEQVAREDIHARQASGLGVDEVEVSLAYRVGLAEPLDLPGQPRYMQFGGVAGVTSRQLDDAARTVRTAEAGDELLDFIASRDFWVNYLRDTYPQSFAEVEEPFVDRLQELTDMAGDDDAAVDVLAVERAEKVQALIVALTKPLLVTKAES
ncbi:NEL-type E3 ubiquitin ligase domain-containing protein [Pseudomonas sp. 2(2015)]|uniref:NEL-type E3 ubiquitin ligase domain-containing protein n=1 Tax=Pseudomonas sp. 2(2015) TaxID=1619950 RepID=UPI000B0E059E|nr:NEL-type E3 ubiquitin ligase domain-containing protein [Pseudomonas sp. 2(2015)]